MKHFTITTEEQAVALRPFRMSRNETPNVGDVVSPMDGNVVITQWDEYPKENAITFDQCMSIVRDEVTEDVMRELSDVDGVLYSPCEYTDHMGNRWHLITIRSICVEHELNSGKARMRSRGGYVQEIPNLTASKLKVLVQILKGE